MQRPDLLVRWRLAVVAAVYLGLALMAAGARASAPPIQETSASAASPVAGQSMPMASDHMPAFAGPGLAGHRTGAQGEAGDSAGTPWRRHGRQRRRRHDVLSGRSGAAAGSRAACAVSTVAPRKTQGQVRGRAASLQGSGGPKRSHPMSPRRRRRRLAAAMALAMGGIPMLARAEPPLVEVWKGPACDGCKDWVKPLEANRLPGDDSRHRQRRGRCPPERCHWGTGYLAAGAVRSR